MAKLHFIEHIEARWPYAPAKGAPLSERVGKALSQLPTEFQQYALALFANVVYLPDVLLRESWGYLGDRLARKLGIDKNELSEQSHLLEVDPTGLIPAFLHENKIHGRLDTDRFARLTSVEDLASNLRLIACSDGEERSIAAAIRLAFSRRYWILLSDNVLSGTSLASDLERCERLVDAFAALGRPIIVPVAQVLTSSAEAVLPSVRPIEYALRFDERFRVVPDNTQCLLFNKTETLDGVLRLSQWISEQNWFCCDEHMRPTIEMSGDAMMYGFKAGGWTIVTPNCPTNSLPALWYERWG